MVFSAFVINRTYYLRVLSGPLLFLLGISSGQAGLFDDERVIEATLTGPINAVIESAEERIEYPFTITVGNLDTPLEVRVRGNSRLRVCEFPPLRLDFPKDLPAESIFAGQDKLKLVTHCNQKSRDAGNVFDEYLVYRLFNLVSEYGYRVRRLRIRYVDTEISEGDGVSQDAFLIESGEELADRIGASIIETPAVYLSQLDQQQAARVYVFQYLIGNTDWSLVTADTDEYCCHNIDLFERDGQTVLVPYDFDLAGLVNATYARPDPSLRLRSVRSRLYRGYCIATQELSTALDQFAGLRNDITSLAAAVPAGSRPTVEGRLGYFEDFFEALAKRDRLLRRFERRCL